MVERIGDSNIRYYGYFVMAFRVSVTARNFFPYNAIRFVIICVFLEGRRCIQRYFYMRAGFRRFFDFLRILYTRNGHGVVVVEVRLVRLFRH